MKQLLSTTIFLMLLLNLLSACDGSDTGSAMEGSTPTIAPSLSSAIPSVQPTPSPTAAPLPDLPNASPQAPAGMLLPKDAIWVAVNHQHILALAPGTPTMTLPEVFRDIVVTPDGTRIVYTTRTQVRTIDTRTGQEQVLFQGPEEGSSYFYIDSLALSPNARKIAFTIADSEEATSPPDLYHGKWALQIVDLDQQQVQILKEGKGKEQLLETVFPYAWLPQGILVHKHYPFANGVLHGLELLDPSSGALTSIDQKTSWSHIIPDPSGRKVILHSMFSDTFSFLDITQGTAQTLTLEKDEPNSPGSPVDPDTLSWSPNESWLVYAVRPAGYKDYTHLQVIAPDGTQAGRVELAALNLPGPLQVVTWRDDAALLLLVVAADYQHVSLYELPREQLTSAGLKLLGEFPWNYDPRLSGKETRIVHLPP